MPLILRLILGIGSAIFVITLLTSIKKSRFDIDLSVIWILLSVVLILFAIFPEIIISFMSLIGIQSAANGIFLLFIAICLILIFYLYKKVSNLEKKVIELVQRIGIDRKE